MFKNLNVKIYCLFLALLLQANFSCNKKLDVVTVEASSEPLHWKSISDSKAHLMGMYGLLRAALVDNNGHWFYGELRSGDFTSYSNPEISAVITSQLNQSYPLLENLSSWRRFYAVINAASLFIEKAPKIMDSDTRYTKTMLAYEIAQARTIRAFTYFYMVRIWGDVPLLTSSFDNGQFERFERTDQRSVLNYAEKELLAAVEDLPFAYGRAPQDYYGSNTAIWQKILFNKISSYAILAHVAAWQGKYIDVDAYTKFIMDNYIRANVTYLREINPSNNSTAGLTGFNGIFSINYNFAQIVNLSSGYVYGEATPTGHIEQLTLARPHINRAFPEIYVTKESIDEIFIENSDTRFGIDEFGLARQNYFYNYSNEIPIFSKIRILRDGVSEGSYAVFGSNLVFTRLEEIALLRAEALAVLGDNISASGLLNEIRTMRRTSGYSPNIVGFKSLIEEIFEERRRELMGEGWRFYDLIRLNKIREVDADIVKMINNKSNLWPISREVIKRNSLVKQNNYWNNN